MPFIHTISEKEAQGTLRELYDQDLESTKYVPNHVKAMSLRPEAIAAWRTLIGTIRSNMPLRRYELVTIAAALALRGAYCLLAHGAVLRKNGFPAEQLEAILRDYRDAGLEPQEVAIMSFADKLTRHAYQITVEDVDGLRGYGLTDVEILDVVLAAAARNFFSKTLDALGAEPDAVYMNLEEPLRHALSGGNGKGE
jgi:uncharacterized peroxidase-related enzyme